MVAEGRERGILEASSFRIFEYAPFEPVPVNGTGKFISLPVFPLRRRRRENKKRIEPWLFAGSCKREHTRTSDHGTRNSMYRQSRCAEFSGRVRSNRTKVTETRSSSERRGKRLELNQRDELFQREVEIKSRGKRVTRRGEDHPGFRSRVCAAYENALHFFMHHLYQTGSFIREIFRWIDTFCGGWLAIACLLF